MTEKENNKEEANHAKEEHKNHEKNHNHHKKQEKKECGCEKKIAELEAASADYKDKYLRALAEAENTRKRTAKEKEDFIKYNRKSIIQDFLPVLDNLIRAQKSLKPEDPEHLRTGVEMVLKHFEDTLIKLGAKPVPESGLYSHDFHHVIHKEPREGKEEGEIIEVYQRGYVFEDGTIIRPATVSVAEAPQQVPEVKEG